MKIFLPMFASLTVATPAFAADSCDPVLVQQTDWQDVTDKSSLSYLNIVDEKTYETAKKKASGSAYGDLFKGDYKSFSDKRRELFRKVAFSQTTDQSRETLKLYLDPDQISGWVKCKGANTELAVTYKDIDSLGATIVLNWTAPATVGSLSNVKVIGIESIPNFRTLNGSREFPIKRPKPGEAVRGSVNGTAGVNSTNYAASIYIPPFSAPPSKPNKFVVPLNGKVRSSLATWSGGTESRSFDCLGAAPSNMEYVEESTRRDQTIFRKGRCVPSGGPYCDSHGERCYDITIVSGCFVNSDWLRWYRTEMSRLGLPVTPANICDVPKASTT